MKTRAITLFFAVTFVIAWGAWWALAYASSQGAQYGTSWFMLVFVVGGLSPTIGAYVAVLGGEGRGGLRTFHGRMQGVKPRIVWYAAALLLPVAVTVVSTTISILLTGELALADLTIAPWYSFFYLIPLMIVGGGLEELGWRGIAWPQLRQWSPIFAVMVVGITWAVWHLPLFYIEGTAQFETNFWYFSIGVFGSTMILGWLYDRTESIIACVLYHAASNASSGLGLSVPDGMGNAKLVEALALFVIGLVFFLLTVRNEPRTTS